MQAVVLDGANQFVRLEERPKPSAGPGEVVIRLKAAAINHRDLNIIDNPRASQVPSIILGSDGAGVVEEVGHGVTSLQSGDAVIINAMLGCGHCEQCVKGEHSLCVNGTLLGGTTWDGTFAEYVRVPAQYVVPKPEHLSFEEAAALPLAFGTAWRVVVSRAKAQPGETLLIHGIGGGVALYALQIAVQLGLRTIVTSSSHEKLNRALTMGAAYGIHYKEEDVAKRVDEITEGRGVDVVVDGAGQIALSIQVAGLNARVVNYGLIDYFADTNMPIDVAMLQGKQLSLMGSNMNTQAEFQSAIRFVNQTKLRPTLSDVLPLADAQTAFRLLKSGGQFGKVVLSIEA